MKLSESCIRELIVHAFDDEELIIFCSDHFPKVCDRFGAGTGLGTKAWLLVQHCRRREQLEDLVEKIREENPRMYEKYRDKLSEPDAVDTPRLDKVKGDTAKLTRRLEAATTVGTTVNTGLTSPRPSAATEHPLAGTLPEIKEWFLERLTFDEQAFLVTAVLFRGLTRQELMALYGDVKDILRPAEVADTERPEAAVRLGRADTDSTATIRIFIATEGTAQVEAPPTPTPGVELPPKPKPIFGEESRLLDMAGLTTVDGQRNTEHGPSRVRLLDFRHPDYGSRLVGLLVVSFPEIFDRMLPYLRQLGIDPRAAVRQRVAEVACELACEMEFVQIKEALLLPWALDKDENANFLAAISLDRIVRAGCSEADVKALLKYWISVSQHDLNCTGMASLVLMGSRWPEETLTLIERVLSPENETLLALAFPVIEGLCADGHVGPVLTRLDRWLGNKDAVPYLREAAAFMFLDLIELSHLAGSGEYVEHVASMLLTGLSPSRLPDSSEIQAAMLEKLKSWAKETLDADTSQAQQTMEALFVALYTRAPTQRDRDRLDFYIGRWSQQDKRFGRFARDRINN